MLDVCGASLSGDGGTSGVYKSGGFSSPGSTSLLADIDRITVLDRPSKDGDRVRETTFGLPSSSNMYFFLEYDFFGVSVMSTVLRFSDSSRKRLPLWVSILERATVVSLVEEASDRSS